MCIDNEPICGCSAEIREFGKAKEDIAYMCIYIHIYIYICIYIYILTVKFGRVGTIAQSD